MPKRATIQDVIKFLEENDVEHQCTLLSTEYINNSTPLKFICNCCGKEFERDFEHLKRKRFKCSACANATSPRPNRLNIEYVKKFIEENDTNHDCTLLSTEYINNITPLKLHCNVCGKDFYRDFNHIGRKRFRCETCGVIAGAKKLVYTKEDVQQRIWNDRQYTLIGEYINAETPVRTKCLYGHEFNLVFSWYLTGNSGCRICANADLAGEDKSTYVSGSHTDLMRHFRSRVQPWRKKILKENTKCDICGDTENLDLHHIKNFSSIVQEASKNTDIPILNTVVDYKDLGLDIEILIQEIIRLHQDCPAVVLRKDYHMLFHSIYGNRNNTLEQYIEFKESKLKEMSS